MWEQRPRIGAWYARMRERPAVRKEMIERMGPEDEAPFRDLQPNPWPKVAAMLH